ncbi:hypothetical protein [Wolbachia endosymbiont of Tribolium confusum]|uniref:hypothetical protein n=1 Tax=Wolbachia endosymbiont of Tribolium confusum TaxID=214474 RepID=UPI001CF4E5B0|nr:hypothetical protein [Wolbachia endosymbiont of Tribolium confusum]MCA7010635.1 hypothetical protein [Wolbachia endosymbiont of Tribolium confusum]
MGITKFVFGFDKSDVKALQESQLGDAAQFQNISDLLGKLKKDQQVDAEQFEKVFGALEDKIGTEQFQAMQEHLSGLQEKFTGLEEKVETFADMVGGQEQAILTCAIVSAVAVIAVTSFVAFCIYQGVKLDKEKKNDLSQDMPSGKFNNVNDTGKLKNNLQQGRV